GFYATPQRISAPQDVILMATSVSDPKKFATAKITLVPGMLSLDPGSAALRAGGAMKFAAQMANASVGAVTWDVLPPLGTLTSEGLYTAPPTITSQQSITIRATSILHPSASATAIVTLLPEVRMSVSPPLVSLIQSQTQQFTASVTGSGNTLVTWSLSPMIG